MEKTKKQKKVATETLCSVRTIRGKICRAPVVDNGKCAVHKSMPSTINNFYSQTLTEDERIEYDTIAVGEISNELKIAKIQLRRVLQRQKVDGSKLQKVKLVKNETDGKETSLVETKEIIDYPDVINKYLSQIGRLENIRAQIQHMVVAVHDSGVNGFRTRIMEMEKMEEEII